MSDEVRDEQLMERAIAAGDSVRGTTSPNPWVGSRSCPVSIRHGLRGSDRPARRPSRRGHGAGPAGGLSIARGATLFTTLEPCAHHGRTPPCTDAIVAAGVARVVIAIEDPDPQVAGKGVALRAAGIEVTVRTAAAEVTEQLRPI